MLDKLTPDNRSALQPGAKSRIKPLSRFAPTPGAAREPCGSKEWDFFLLCLPGAYAPGLTKIPALAGLLVVRANAQSVLSTVPVIEQRDDWGTPAMNADLQRPATPNYAAPILPNVLKLEQAILLCFQDG